MTATANRPPRPAAEDAEIRTALAVMRSPNEGLPQRLHALAKLTARRGLTDDERTSVRIHRESLARLVREAGVVRAGATDWYVGDDGILRERLPQ